MQKRYVPKYYGEVECPKAERTGTRALILSYVDGIPLSDEDKAGYLELDHLEDILWESIRAVADLNVKHDDLRLDNYILAGDRIVLIDFDSSYIDDDTNEEDREYFLGCAVAHVYDLYQAVHSPDDRSVPRRFKSRHARPPSPSYYRTPQAPPGFILRAPGSAESP